MHICSMLQKCPSVCMSQYSYRRCTERRYSGYQHKFWHSCLLSAITQAQMLMSIHFDISVSVLENIDHY